MPPVRARARVRVLVLRAFLVSICGVVVLSVACGGSTDEPGLLGTSLTPDAAASSTATATTTATTARPVVDSGPVDSGPGCSTIDELLGTYGLAPACAPCIDNSCASLITTCNASCSCPMAAVGFVQCISLGANSSTCAAVASAATDPATVLGLLMCSSVCQAQCHVLDAGDDGGGDAGDAGDASPDAGSDAAK